MASGKPFLTLHALNRFIQRGIPLDPAFIDGCSKAAALFRKKPQKFTICGITIVGGLNEANEPCIVTVYRKGVMS